MPDLATAESREEAISKLEPDFHGLMERKGIAELLQATLTDAGVKSTSIFSVIGENVADIRQFAVDHCNLDRGRDVVTIAGLIDQWDACNTRMITRHKAEAEAISSAMPPPLNRKEAQDLKSKFGYVSEPSSSDIATSSFNSNIQTSRCSATSGRICLTTRGEVVSTPSLELVLSYEYQVRKLVVKLMNDGVEMSDALTTAMTDSTTKRGVLPHA